MIFSFSTVRFVLVLAISCLALAITLPSLALAQGGGVDGSGFGGDSGGFGGGSSGGTGGSSGAGSGVGPGGNFSPDRGWGSDPTGPSTGGTSSDTGRASDDEIAITAVVSVTLSSIMNDTLDRRSIATPTQDRTTGLFSVSVSTEFGDGSNNSTTNPTLTPNPTNCLSPANLVVQGMSFSNKETPGTYMTATDLDIGNNYIPSVLVTNIGCSATGAGTAGTNFRNQAPKGSAGSFPVHLEIDFDSNGTIDYNNTIDSVGPLAAGQSIIVAFPAFAATDAGNHKALATADPVGLNGISCTGNWGCVKETNETNDFTLQFSVTRPSVDLGSVLITADEFCNREDPGNASLVRCDRSTRAVAPVLRGLYRDVKAGEEVALLWSGNKIDYSTCTGNRSDFEGQFGPPSINVGIASDRKANSAFALKHYDTTIDEPPAKRSHTYTITCKTTGGGTVSDTHILNHGADLSDIINITPTVNNRTVAPNTDLRDYRFSLKNTSSIAVSEFTYQIFIDKVDVTRGENKRYTNIGIDSSVGVNGHITWKSPATPSRVPVRVCVSHQNMATKQCAGATIIVADNRPECSDDIDNDGDSLVDSDGNGDPALADPGCDNPTDDNEAEDPTITATPNLVRHGETTQIDWDPRGNQTCQLSDNLGTSGIVTEAGSASIPITAEAVFTISCVDHKGNPREASATVRALPIMYET